MGPGVGVGAGVGVGVGITVAPGVGVGVGLGVGVGEKPGGKLGSTGYEDVGVGVAFLACPGFGVECFVSDGFSATAPFVPLGDVEPAGVFDNDCCGPSQRNSSKASASVMMMPRRLNMNLLRHQFTLSQPVTQFVRSHQSLTTGSQIEIARFSVFDFLRRRK